jgi:hypothetical protein
VINFEHKRVREEKKYAFEKYYIDDYFPAMLNINIKTIKKRKFQIQDQKGPFRFRQSMFVNFFSLSASFKKIRFEHTFCV